MLTLPGIYEHGQLLLEEPVNTEKKYKVLVTFIGEVEKTDTSKKRPFGILKGILRTPDDINDSIEV